MVLDAVSNFVRGETDAAIDNTQTTVSVVDASIFPDPASDGEYNVVIWDASTYPRPDQDPDVEILRVAAIDTGTNDLTVFRGQEATAGASHPSGSAVHLSPTAKMFGDIESTFADFWDAGAQELTADVNNSVVSTESASVTNQLSAGSVSAGSVLNGSSQIVQLTVTIADGGIHDVANDTVFDGFLFANIGGDAGVFYLSGYADSVFEVFATSNFTTTEGNSGTVNVYLDSNNSYQIENLIGSSVDVVITRIENDVV